MDSVGFTSAIIVTIALLSYSPKIKSKITFWILGFITSEIIGAIISTTGRLVTDNPMGPAPLLKFIIWLALTSAALKLLGDFFSKPIELTREQSIPTTKSYKSEFWSSFTRGTLAITSLPLFVLSVCFSTDGKCSGLDSFYVGAIFSLFIFFPALFIFISSSVYLFKKSFFDFNQLNTKQRSAVITYSLIILTIFVEFVIYDTNHLKVSMRNLMSYAHYPQLDQSNSLSGPDKNNNQIRDDIEPFLKIEAVEAINQYRTEYAKATYKVFKAKDNAESFNALEQKHWIWQCALEYTSEHYPRESFMKFTNDIDEMYLNTNKRIQWFERQENKFTQSETHRKEMPEGYCKQLQN